MHKVNISDAVHLLLKKLVIFNFIFHNSDAEMKWHCDTTLYTSFPSSFQDQKEEEMTEQIERVPDTPVSGLLLCHFPPTTYEDIPWLDG